MPVNFSSTAGPAPRSTVFHGPSGQAKDAKGVVHGFRAMVMRLFELFLSPEAIARRRIAWAARTGAESLNLSSMKLVKLPSTIGTLTRLHILHLWHNQLTSLPLQIGRCAQLKELYLSDNQLASLPDSLLHLTQLRRLYLHGNPKLHIPTHLLGPRWEVVKSSGCAASSPKMILEHYFHRHSL
jgi:Leucine-rich repeat (LRR) protein